MQKYKFSIIIPVYNTEKYLEKCLDSIINQSYQNMEIIVVNDGSTDNSKDILFTYQNKYPKLINVYEKINGGLSDARNYGVSKASGDYLLFVDSDDYLESDLLLNISKNIKDDVDVIRFNFKRVMNQEEIISTSNNFTLVDGKKAFDLLIKSNDFVVAWAYAYKKEYWLEKKFQFTKGIYHEDFAITPLVIRSASKVSSIAYVGYNYVIRENSIMTTNNHDKILKKAFDVIKIFDNLTNYYQEDKVFQSYVANATIDKAKTLSGSDLKKYIKELKKRQIYKYLLDDTLGRKIKKIFIKLNLSFYLKFFK